MMTSTFTKIASILFFVTVFLPNSSHGADHEARIVFISVATETDEFWSGVHGMARAAANDLGIDLEILLSNRNHRTAVKMAKDVATRQNKPDYVIVVGEKLIARGSIPALTKNGIKVFLLGNLSKRERADIGEPREKYPNYIGRIGIDDYSAGYQTAEMMVQEAIRKKLHDEDGRINFLALEGTQETPFNSERVRGRNRAFKRYGQARILQSVSTDWSYQYATSVLPVLWRRYSDYRIAGIWCANEPLARASADFLKSHKKAPGIDVLTAGTDWNRESVERVKQGDLLCVAGGHAATVAWILILIHDYHNGTDFGSNVFLSKVTILDKQNSETFLKYFGGNNWEGIDFTRFSKTENDDLKEYVLSFDAILDSLN